MARLRCSVVLFAALMLPVWGQNFVTGPNTGAESRLDNTPRNATFFLTVTGSGTYSLAGGIFFMKDGTSTTDNVTLTVFNSAAMALGSVTLSNSQFCANDPAHCQSYSYRTFALPSPLALSPGSYTLVLSTNAPPQQNSAYFVKGDGTSFSVSGTVPPAPNLSISKTSSPANFTAGMAGAAYTVQVTNVGNASTSGVITVMDTLGPNQTIVSAIGSGWTCMVATPVLVTCTTSAVIAAGTSAPLITITVNVAANAAPSVTNTATVSGGGGTNTNNSFTLTTPVSAPNLSVLKTSNTATFTQGQNGAYTIQVNNVGNGASSGTITITDTLDTNQTIVSASGSGWSCSAAGQVVTCTTGAVIAAGGSASPITLTVSVLANGESSVTNTGTVAGGGGTNTNNSFRLVTPVVVPNLSVSKTASPSAFSKGQNGVYTILVSNGGTAPSSGVITVTDTLDPNLTFVSATPPPGWTCMPAGQVVTCTTSTAIAVGASVSITITVNVGASAPTTVTNNVTVSGGGSATNSSQLVSAVNATDLTISKTANPTTFTQGQKGVVYTITASNIGNAPSSGLITVTDTLDPNLTFVSASGSGWTCSAAGQVVTCTTSAAIAVSSSAPPITVTVNVAANGQTSATNMVTISGGGNVVNSNTSFTLVSVVNNSNLSVSKTATTFTQGQSGAYTITATNVGNAASSGTITVTDTLDPNLTFVSATGSGWTCSAAAQVVTCTMSAVIAAGASGPPITINVNVGASAPTSVTNNVTVAGGGGTNTNNSFQLVSNVSGAGPPPVTGVPATTTPMLILTGMALIGLVAWLRRRATYRG